MNKKTLFLIAGILSLLVFIGHLTESGPQKLLGFTVNIWVIRLAWLFLCVSNFYSYWKIKKSET